MKNISVLMSVYNEPLDWLKGSIESILNQTFTDFEFIIVNDNPGREELRDVLKSYMNKDERITIIENPENLGLTKSLNIGLKEAKGKYVARMDADDMAMPERLELQYQFLEKHKDIFLAGSSARIIDRDGVLKEKVIKHNNHKQIVRDIFTGKLPFYHPTIMFRNNGFLYREKFETTQDHDFYLNLLSKGKKFNNLKQILLYYRMSDQSISMTKRRKQIILKKLALQFYYERAKTGKDSYQQLDFNDQPQVLNFLKIDPQELEATILKEQTIFALGANNVAAARKAFALYTEHAPLNIERLALWIFVGIPFLYRLYRKLRYEILRV